MIESWAVKKVLEAFENKDVGCVQSLVVQRCVDPNGLIPSKGVSLLHLIIGHQSESFALRVSKLFLRCGGDPNVASADGVTPVHVAAAWGRTRILHLLLVNGGDPWVQDDEKKNAFNYAFEEREWGAIEMLHHFQQMHSAAQWRQEAEPKYERSLERVLLRRGGDVFAYAAGGQKCVKSMTTQTQGEVGRSPVQDRIRYFEPEGGAGAGAGAGVESWEQKEGKGEMGWVKDFYQSACEVVVHEEGGREGEGEREGEKKTFVSSVQIETSPASESAVERSEQSSADVRGQLFVELQEAVQRRSRQRTGQGAEGAEGVAVVEDPSKDSFVAKEVSYLYGVNLEESAMLKNMSDFATKVMKEIEVTEAERPSDSTVDLCGSSPDLTGPYLSCDDPPAPPSAPPPLLPARNDSDASNLYLTPYNSDIVRPPLEDNSNDSFLSLAEEYKYTDPEEGVTLLEKKLVVTPTISFCQAQPPDASGEGDASAASSDASAVPLSLSYNSDALRSELLGLGFSPGPVTATTKKLYLRKLWKLRKDARPGDSPPPHSPPLFPAHSRPLRRTLADDDRFREISAFARLEEEMSRSFETWTKRRWRQGTHRTSFNYLLLDPRRSLNLPRRAPPTPTRDTFRDFLSAIFYVGKGKRARPYAHLYQAAAAWEKRAPRPPDAKTQTIIDIWRDGLGVVCLQVFQNTMAVEALTREAAMMEALGASGLRNARAGEYYGVAATWPAEEKARLGVYLLHKAMLIFLNEGERQIKPYDVD